LTTDISATPVIITGYAARIRQALLNILVNSLEAMPNKGELSIRLTADDRAARISMCDSGPGIPSSLSQKIFDMHFTTRESGTGIGLYVTRGVVEQHGGSIEVRGELGRGTCFEVTLPLSQTRLGEAPRGNSAVERFKD
jgi:signal transduction histidine kinase